MRENAKGVRRVDMTSVGEPKRILIVEPLDDPVPREVPYEPEKPVAPVHEPETRPAGVPSKDR